MSATVYEYWYYDAAGRVCESGMTRLAATIEQVIEWVRLLVFSTHPHIHAAEIAWVVNGVEQLAVVDRSEEES